MSQKWRGKNIQYLIFEPQEQFYIVKTSMSSSMIVEEGMVARLVHQGSK